MIGTENAGLVAIAGLAACLSNICYMLGGTSGFGGLWVRRILGVLILGLATNIVAVILSNWVWQYLLFFPCLGIGMSFGYGADTNIGKALKRLVFALGVLSCCVFGMWAHGFSGSSILITVLATITGFTSIALGVFNPFNNAPVEQFLISQVLTIYVAFWAFVK